MGFSIAALDHLRGKETPFSHEFDPNFAMTFVQEVHRYFDQLPQYAWIMKL